MQRVIKLIYSQDPIFSEVGLIVEEIRQISAARNFGFRFVHQTGNKVAHFIAHHFVYRSMKILYSVFSK